MSEFEDDEREYLMESARRLAPIQAAIDKGNLMTANAALLMDWDELCREVIRLRRQLRGRADGAQET